MENENSQSEIIIKEEVKNQENILTINKVQSINSNKTPVKSNVTPTKNIQNKNPVVNKPQAKPLTDSNVKPKHNASRSIDKNVGQRKVINSKSPNLK